MHICVNCHAPLRPFAWSCNACGWRAAVHDGVACLAPEMLQDNDGFHEPLFDEYQKLQAEHFWFVYRRKLIVWALQRYFPRFQSFLRLAAAQQRISLRLQTGSHMLRYAVGSLRCMRCKWRAAIAQRSSCKWTRARSLLSKHSTWSAPLM